MKRAKRLESIPPYLFGEISRMKAKAISEGKNLIDLGIGDPDLPTPKPIIDKMAELIYDPLFHRYDETETGWVDFIASVKRYYKKRFNVELNDNEAMLLIGSKDGLAHFVWAMVDPGDVVLCPNPGYTVVKVNSMMAGAEIVDMPLLEENGFLPDFEKIPFDKAEKAKVMYLNYPNNPTGAVCDLDFYQRAVDFANKYDIAIISDIAYADVTYDGYVAPSMLQAEGAMNCVIELHSLSKTYNMTGWRCGFACGNEYLISALNKFKSNCDSRQFPAIDMASAYALDNVKNDETLAVYKERRDILVNGLRELGWNVPCPKGSLYVWARVPEGYTSAEFTKKLLNEAGVLVIPGNGYGNYGEGYVRMSLTVSGDVHGSLIKEFVKRIKDSGIKF
ncbi:MAG: LL-diaminopimelate aminotransferase [Abditibacteriota bacterium]|nr:LL-diaminopimelate aminotransferase [Abditibacteriota bacterium]